MRSREAPRHPRHPRKVRPCTVHARVRRAINPLALNPALLRPQHLRLHLFQRVDVAFSSRGAHVVGKTPEAPGRQNSAAKRSAQATSVCLSNVLLLTPLKVPRVACQTLKYSLYYTQYEASFISGTSPSMIPSSALSLVSGMLRSPSSRLLFSPSLCSLYVAQSEALFSSPSCYKSVPRPISPLTKTLLISPTLIGSLRHQLLVSSLD